jgi:hypothetical protein
MKHQAKRRIMKSVWKCAAAAIMVKHFRRLLDVEPDNPVVYYWLAEFLSTHRPDAAPEAFLRARKALDLPACVSLHREKIEQLIAKI